MKETMKQHLHAAERKTIQSMIRREYDGWRPKALRFFTSPPTGEKPAAAQPKTPASNPILAAAPSPPRFRTQNEP